MRIKTTLLAATLVALALPLFAQPGAGPATSDWTIEVQAERLPVISQDRTGTCWSFATASFFESEIVRLTGQRIDLSEMHFVRHTILEKSKRRLLMGDLARFTEGGLSHDLTFIGKHYGAVPVSLDDGFAGEPSKHDHSELWTLLNSTLETLQKRKAEKKLSAHWERAITGLVDAYLGPAAESVPTEKGAMSPVDWARDVAKLEFDRYVQVMSFQHVPYGEEGELFVPDNWLRFDGYHNMPLDDMMGALDAALKAGFTAAVDMDVSEKGFQARRGMAVLEPKHERAGAITPELREAMFLDGRTSDDHLMHAVGIARDAKGKKFYIVKNSWGQIGPHKGNIMVSEAFMRAKLLSFMVHEDALKPAKAGAEASGSR